MQSFTPTQKKLLSSLRLRHGYCTLFWPTEAEFQMLRLYGSVSRLFQGQIQKNNIIWDNLNSDSSPENLGDLSEEKYETYGISQMMASGAFPRRSQKSEWVAKRQQSCK